MECGEQCVIITGITMMPELCADNWDMMSTTVSYSLYNIDDLVECKESLVLQGYLVV